MASSTALLSIPLPSLAVLVILLSCHRATGCYNAIFSFGDSLADTGNLLDSSQGLAGAISQLPYGETYFHRPTGRFSDGRLVIDFIAQAIGVPLVRPYLAGGSGEDFRYGANFAVGGATALNESFFKAKGMAIFSTNYSLSAQVDWFKQLLPSLPSTNSDFSDIMNNSLFVMGEIGGNDYNYPLFQGTTANETRNFVPSVIDEISSATKSLIQLGAKTLVVPNIFPLGCASFYLSRFQSQRKEDYDPESGCIAWVNELVEYHNSQLQKEVDQLRGLYPNITIIYADFYGPVMSIYQSPKKYGFKETLNACCGGDGPYNVNISAACGSPKAKVCSDPSSHACWDGLHLTEATYRTVANGFLEGPYTTPPLPSPKTCLHSHSQSQPSSAQCLRVF